MRRLNVAKPAFDFIPFKGGLDVEARTWEAQPGTLRESQNYEIGGTNNSSYVDIQGYEVFDGQAAPSAATYSVMNVTITGSISVGDTITQLVSGATAYVLAVVITTTPNYLVLTDITGTFDATNDLQVSAVTEGTALSVTSRSGATSPLLHATYLNLAADQGRTVITAVPGSGSVLGVTMLDDVWYAWRNAVGDATAELYKSTAAGWVNVPLGLELSFTSGGTYVISEGDTITGATSASTAVVTRVVLESGSFAGGDAAGRLIMASISGPFQAENLNVGASTNVATIAGNATAITMLPDGRFVFAIENFGGQSSTRRIYGCDGVNRAFEFDGTVFVPIATGVTADTPGHVIVHKNHLFLSFGSSVQHSATGQPYLFDPIFGAAELAIGDVVTGFMSEPGSEGNAALGIYARTVTSILYGTSALDWNLVRFRDGLGAVPYTLQQFGKTTYLDNRGITTLQTAQTYGNFQQATVSGRIQNLIDAKRSIAVASCICRNKNQYRIFFTDKTGLYVTTDGKKIVGFMPVIFDHAVTCISSLEQIDGTEIMMFGSTDGKVYQLDSGTSFDGGEIEAYLKLHYTFNKAIRWLKSYKSITLEAQGEGYSEFSLTTELDYSSTDRPQPLAQNEVLSFASVNWDSFTWDAFTWDGQNLGPANLKLEGTAENISLIIYKNSDKFTPISLAGAMIRYILRRQLR